MKRKRKKIVFLALVLILVLAVIGSFDKPSETQGSEPSGSSTIQQLQSVADSPDSPGNEDLQDNPSALMPDADEKVNPGDVLHEELVIEPVEVSDEKEIVPPTELPQNSTFEVHYLDVGQGDCSLVLCDGHAMLIDGGEASESSKVYAYLQQHGVSHLDYMVASHAHSDHIGGLSGALNYATVDTAFCPVTDYDSKTFNSMIKYLDKQGIDITVPSAGDEFMLGSAHVQILSPQKSYDEPNDTSIVLKVTYGETSFLFTGDAERTAEADILDAGYNLSSTVLKVGHHGSDTSTSYPFLKEIMPKYAVIQVGKDNSYGHPTEDILSRLRDADVKVYRNDLQGDIICSSDGEDVSFTTKKNESVQTNPTVVATPDTTESDDAGEYIGNKNSDM